MANPVIKVSSVSGSASPGASGAGPAVAITGTNNATSNGATPSVITLGGSPDLSGVATDGGHAIYIATAAGRRFSKITAVDNVAKTVTIEDTITAANCTNRSWAIGGMLSSLWASTGAYVLLVDDGVSSGDAKADWTVEFQSGHVESAATTTIRVSGSASGRFTVRGVEGAATRPVITTSNTNGVLIASGVVGVSLDNFEVKNSLSAAGYVVRSPSGNASSEITRLKVSSTGATKATRGVSLANRSVVASCEIFDVANGVEDGGETATWNNYIHDCTTKGVDVIGTIPGAVLGNVIVDCPTGWAFGSSRVPIIIGNVFDTCSTMAINHSGDITSGTALFGSGPVVGNVFCNCTTGVGWTHANMSSVGLCQYILRPFVSNNIFYNNTNHWRYSATTTNDLTGWVNWIQASAEPFTVATKAARKTAGNWTGNDELKAKGFPQTVVGLMAVSRSYVDAGLQRQETAGGSSIIIIED